MSDRARWFAAGTAIGAVATWVWAVWCDYRDLHT